MDYLLQQYRALQKGLANGDTAKSILPLKWYIQRLMAEQICRYLPERGSTLEVGCGGSFTLQFLSLRGHEAVGLDIDTNALEYSSLLTSHFQSDVRLVQGTALALPFDDSTFDYVYSVGLIEHFQICDQRAAVREMIRVAKRYVHLEIPNPHPFSTFWVIGAESKEMHLPCNPGILLHEAGLGLIEIDGRCVFDVLDKVDRNPAVQQFIRSRAPDLLVDEFTEELIDRLCEAERSCSTFERLIYGFQTYWVGDLQSRSRDCR